MRLSSRSNQMTRRIVLAIGILVVLASLYDVRRTSERSRIPPVFDNTTQALAVRYPQPDARRFGVVHSDPRFLASTRTAGVSLRTIGVYWERFEPREGEIDAAYVRVTVQQIGIARAAGYEIILDLGVHYPPAWLWDYPNSRYVNQWGEEFHPLSGGANGVNAVFNNAMRAKQARYIREVFSAFGTDFYGVRLGWGYFGELNYPHPGYGERTNAYWAYDALAQGRAKGLPAGMTPSPVAGWVPGTPSADHMDARLFIDWYMRCLQNYHDWQIATVRAVYDGRLLMLYSSWGVRPTQLESAVSHDLDGSSSAEHNGELQRGFDFARFIAGISDPDVVIYTTWLDADTTGDTTTDMRRWSPVHYLAYLAARHPLRLTVWGENTGRGTFAAMQRSFEQMQRYGLPVLIWAFEEDLYSSGLATVYEYGSQIEIHQ